MMMNRLGIGDLEDETFIDYMRRQPEWVKSGSGLGAKLSIEYDGSIHKLRLNKRAAMNYSTPFELACRLDSLPIICAGATEKFENGKQRALYPTDIFSYYVSRFLLRHAENKMNRESGFELRASPIEMLHDKFRFLNTL